MNPRFDIIVPTFNRRNELPEFFRRNEALNKKDVVVWLVDDCSVERIDDVLPTWPNLRYIRLTRNQGQTFARNVAIEQATAPYIVSLDDDAWFEDASPALDELERLFQVHPEAGCVMFNIATPHSQYSARPTGTRIPLHVTCGCAFRRSGLLQAGGFSDFLHSQAEETDLSIRIYRLGMSIIFAREVKVFHNFSPGNRPVKWYFYNRHNTTRNDLLIVVMYYPLHWVIPYLVGKFMSHLRFAVSYGVAVAGTIWYTWKALFSFFGLLPEAIRRRRPMTKQQFKDWRSLLNSSYPL